MSLDEKFSLFAYCLIRIVNLNWTKMKVTGLQPYFWPIGWRHALRWTLARPICRARTHTPCMSYLRILLDSFSVTPILILMLFKLIDSIACYIPFKGRKISVSGQMRSCGFRTGKAEVRCPLARQGVSAVGQVVSDQTVERHVRGRTMYILKILTGRWTTVREYDDRASWAVGLSSFLVSQSTYCLNLTSLHMSLQIHVSALAQDTWRKNGSFDRRVV